MIFEGQGAALGIHPEKPSEWSLHSCNHPFSGQGMPVPTTSGPSIHLRHYRKTTARATLHPSCLVFMKTICLPLALLRPQNRKYHHCLGSVTNLSVNVYIFLSHLLKYGLLGDFYRRLIISICADFCQFHFQSNLISTSGDGTVALCCVKGYQLLDKGMLCVNQISQVA